MQWVPGLSFVFLAWIRRMHYVARIGTCLYVDYFVLTRWFIIEAKLSNCPQRGVSPEKRRFGRRQIELIAVAFTRCNAFSTCARPGLSQLPRVCSLTTCAADVVYTFWALQCILNTVDTTVDVFGKTGVLHDAGHLNSLQPRGTEAGLSAHLAASNVSAESHCSSNTVGLGLCV